MPALYGSVATVAVASIYYVWKLYLQAKLQREKTLRERVAYMLWVMAHEDEYAHGRGFPAMQFADDRPLDEAI